MAQQPVSCPASAAPIALPSPQFRVRTGYEILPSDKVTIHMSPYDLSKGRIVHRYK